MKSVSKETRRRMSEAAKIRCTPEWRAAKSQAYESKLPADEVELLYRSGLTQTEVADHFGVTQKVICGFMRRHGIAARPAIKRNQNGANNDSWKGDDATYSAFHFRVEAVRGKPSCCTSCNKTTGRFEWANLTGRYEDVNDYVRLCVSCHRRFDAKRRTMTGKATSTNASRKRKAVDS